MIFYSLQCTCGCSDPLIRENNTTKEESIIIFRSKELAEIEASFIKDGHGNTPKVVEFQINEKA